MTDLDARIRARLDSMWEGHSGFDSCAGCEVDCYCQACPTAVQALIAVLNEHRQSHSLVWDVPRDPSGEPRRELHPWCVCQERDGMTGEERWPCPTVLAMAKELRIEVD